MVTNSTATMNNVSAVVFALMCCVGVSAVNAKDIVPAKVQSDEQISVWVDNASLDLFVSQLAVITGRDASIEGKLQGQVSGRFNGTMLDTLNTVGAQFPILFDLDDSILGAVAETGRSNATIALGDFALDEQIKGSLLDGMLPGNSVDIRDDEVVVSGHPSFVNRIAKVVTMAIARIEPVVTIAETNDVQAPEPVATIADTDVLQVPERVATIADTDVVQVPERVATIADTDVVQAPELVIDTASSEILDDIVREVLAVEQADTETASVSQSSSDEILWVTDIPGYETF